MNDEIHLLIVDDEPNIRSGLSRGLQAAVDVIETAGNAAEALSLVEAGAFELLIADVRLPGTMNGLELVSQVLEMRPATTIIVITADGTVETAVDAMKRGAFDFISKPIDLNLLRQQVDKAVRHHRLRDENRKLRERLVGAGEITGMIGNCTAIEEVFRQIRQVADTDATVMIQGESGTGKELVARAVHDLSERCEQPFVPINLGALPETLLESELFGHEKGSFSGATRQKPGCFEQAGRGTLFLDEVTEMSAKSQVDLLRVLESGTFMRVGGETQLHSHARLVSASNKDTLNLVREGAFREDLFYRLNVVPIVVPPLRERRADIPLLIEHFLQQFCARHSRPYKQLDAAAVNVMTAAPWPGNVRQLRNVVERIVITSPGKTIGVSDLPGDLVGQTANKSLPSSLRPLSDVVEETEKQTIIATLAACDFHREKAAKVLAISIRTLHYKMSRYGIH